MIDRNLTKLKKITTNGAHYLHVPCETMEEAAMVYEKAHTLDRMHHIMVFDYPPIWYHRNMIRGIYYYDTRHDFRKRRCEYHILKREDVEEYWLGKKTGSKIDPDQGSGL